MGGFSINDTALRGRGNCSRRVARRDEITRPQSPLAKDGTVSRVFRGGMTWCARCLHPLFRPFRYTPHAHPRAHEQRNETRAGPPRRSSHNTISKFFLTLKSEHTRHPLFLYLRHCSWTVPVGEISCIINAYLPFRDTRRSNSHVYLQCPLRRKLDITYHDIRDT